MTGRMRSPSYPSTSLEQAIDYINKIHQIERTNPVDREVAAKALGYSGISGRSATVLSNLIQYGLLEKAGKNGVRVTERAVEILYPDTPRSKADALQAAAEEPDLYQRVKERFPDAEPSENALHSFFVKLGFTDTAIPAAIRSYKQTYSFLENAIEYERNSQTVEEVTESQPYQQVERSSPMQSAQHTSISHDNARHAVRGSTASMLDEGPGIQFVQKRIWLSGVINTRQQADELIATINALKPMLKDASAEETTPPQDDVSDLMS